MAIIDKILQIMKDNNETQAELAKATGLSSGLISQWKKKSQRPSMAKLQVIAMHYGVSMDELLQGEPEYATYIIEKTANQLARNIDSRAADNPQDISNREAAKKQLLLDDKLIAFYGECKPYLTKDDIDDIALFMKMKAERKKENGET